MPPPKVSRVQELITSPNSPVLKRKRVARRYRSTNRKAKTAIVTQGCFLPPFMLPFPTGLFVSALSRAFGFLLVTFISSLAASHYQFPDPYRRLPVGYRDMLARLAAYARFMMDHPNGVNVS